MRRRTLSCRCSVAILAQALLGFTFPIHPVAGAGPAVLQRTGDILFAVQTCFDHSTPFVIRVVCFHHVLRHERQSSVIQKCNMISSVIAFPSLCQCGRAGFGSEVGKKWEVRMVNLSRFGVVCCRWKAGSLGGLVCGSLVERVERHSNWPHGQEP